MDNLFMEEEDISRINKTLKNLLKESEAKLVLLINQNGFLISKQGFSQALDTTSLAALSAGAFASTKAIAKLLGESEFSVLFHQGKRDNIHFSLVDSRAILCIVFENTTTIGLVRLFAKEAGDLLAQVLNEVRNRTEIKPIEGGLKLSEDRGSMFKET